MNTSSHADRKKRRSQRGFALLMSVLAVAGLMVMLIGLLSMLTLERKTARSYSDAARADMALQSGLAEAIGTISPIANRDDTLVFRMEDTEAEIDDSAIDDKTLPPEHFFTFGAQYDTQKKEWRVSPFASGFKQILGGSDVPQTTAIKQAMLDYEPVEIAGVGRGNVAVPKASWVILGEKTDPFTMRYAWWAEDLTGRIDGAYAGSEKREFGLDAREVGLFTIFNPSAEKDGAGPEDALITQRENLRSTASVRQLLTEANAKIIEPYLTYDLPREVNAAPLIPHGFGYPDAGGKALSLDEMVTTRDVEEITSHIDRNLPQFTLRRGGMLPTENYTKTIAASIIDYADVDTNPTLGLGYRGVDSYPFVNELFDRYEWTGTSGGQVVIRVTTFVELWNPSNISISGSFQLENDNRHSIKIPPAATANFTSVQHPPTTVSIPANGFIVRNCGFKDYTFPVGAFPPSSLEFPTETKNSTYRLKWNSLQVDWARGGVTRTTGTLRAGPTNAKWKGNASPAHDHSIGQHGDPRASHYINAPIFPNNYDKNSNWGGRALKADISNANYREVKITRWPDRGSESKTGAAPGSDTKLPTTLPLPVTQSSMSPAFIANRPFLSTAELGNIFDPAQWTSIETTSGTSSPGSGGGFTLAIGRPEYAKFDREGQRAAQLLDLFTLSDASATQRNSRIPKININTAPREVLRCLVAGQPLTNDPIFNSLYPPKDQSIGDRFADAVIASRQHAPLRGLSDLNLIRKNPLKPRNYTTPDRDTEPFFGSREQYPVNGRPADTWDDAGREELFQRIANMVTFQGKTFRIIVAGQVLDRSGKIVGQRTREITVRFEPKRDAQGLIDTTQPFVVSTLSERSL
jgi:hypothetical protein